jgi:adenylate cyclase class IV
MEEASIRYHTKLPKISSSVQIVNIEIKASCNRLDEIRKILKSHTAVSHGIDHQCDTYFVVPSGRLKLREGTIENALIHYVRNNTSGPKQSDVMLYDTTPLSSIKKILTKALGVLTVVDKQREIYFIDNVKFHLDHVETLGDFVEIEAIDRDGTIGRGKLLQQCRYYMNLFAISDKDCIETSYSDMLLSQSCNAVIQESL